MSSSTMNPSYIDENIKKILKRAKKIAQEMELYDHKAHSIDFKVSPETVVGIAAMIQLEVMNAPIIMMNMDPKTSEGIVQSGKTYEIVNNKGEQGIRCLKCNLTSYNYNDIEQRYCGNCHIFHEDLKGGDLQ